MQEGSHETNVIFASPIPNPDEYLKLLPQEKNKKGNSLTTSFFYIDSQSVSLLFIPNKLTHYEIDTIFLYFMFFVVIISFVDSLTYIE